MTGFLMIPLATLYEENTDRSTLTEQNKKPSWAYSSPITKVGSEQLFF